MKMVTASGFFYFAMAASVAAAAPATSGAQRVPPPPPPPPAPAIEIAAPESPETAASRVRAMQQVITLDVEVLGGGERLWTGSLRVSSQQSGEYNATQSQARLPCPGTDPDRGYGNGLQDRLTLSFQRRDWNRDIDGFYIRVSWTHPREACGNAAGQSVVGFDQGFSLRPGDSTQLTGDGGLVVKVTRRR